MCSEPITQDDKTFACRSCNECIAARKNDWVARCMAEKQTTTETVILDLTYRNNPDGTLPDNARAFRYSDVQLFLKSLREEYYREYEARGEIRYIVAGERGSDNNRVHWHMVIFGQRPIARLGKWFDFTFKPIAEMKMEKMVHWSYWPFGHVYPQVPDQGGMKYVLKYALKDQFNSVKSKGTNRFTKSNDNGASMFKMSKKPPIGQKWLEQKVKDWEALNVVPVKLELKIPDYSGYWWPKGKQREYLLDEIYRINEGIKQKTGRDAPQWQALLSSVVNKEKDWEGLIYGPQEETRVEHSEEVWKANLARQQASRARAAKAASIRYHCGGALVCIKCWRGKTKQEKESFREWYEEQKSQYKGPFPITRKSLDEWKRKQGTINPYCGFNEIEEYKAAFKGCRK